VEGRCVTPQSAKPRVLIADDTPANRLAFEAILDRDFNVTLAESGIEVLELCRRQDFAVIILDVRMPGMGGFETAKALRGPERASMPPIIIFTSAYDQNVPQITRGFAAGATDFLFSPVEPDVLKLKVATYARMSLQFEAMRLEVRNFARALGEAREELARHGLAASGPPGSPSWPGVP
jgi:CheY-like chemotaxis protein